MSKGSDLGLQDRRDVLFLVRDVLQVGRLFDLPAFADHSFDDYEMILQAADDLAREVWLPTMTDGDRQGARWQPDGSVTLPASFAKAFAAYRDGGWITLGEPEEHGGTGLPKALSVHPIAEIMAANVSLFFLPGLCHAAGELVAKVGTPEQVERYASKLYAGQWGGTMCLTEPEAGSDLGALRTVAEQQADGTWHLRGQKIFITFAEHDLTENILYPVLARVEGDPAGTKGITMFLASKYKLNPDGTLPPPGQRVRNGVQCTGIEHKMGIHASPTCQLSFGEDEPCVAEMLGDRCRGLTGMFHMMNTARIAVGLQSLGAAEAAYRYAHGYALERTQGGAAEDFRDAGAKRVRIMRHPDVRRQLLELRAVVEGTRALLGFAALQHDLSVATAGREAEDAAGLLGLLTPLCKGYVSEVCATAIADALLLLGGHGYLRDHPLEQYLRDTVIARIYEGTTGIQALDLVARKMGAKGGLSLMSLLGQIDKTAKRAAAAGLEAPASAVRDMRRVLGETAMRLGGAFGGGDLAGPLLQATPMMFLFGDVVFAWLHLWMATVAAEKLAEAPEAARTAFHRNKIRTARHYISQAGPRVVARAATIAQGERAPLEFEFEGET